MNGRPPLRLLVVLPSWVGDVVMATPTLRALRQAFPGAFIGGLVRPGCDELLAGTNFLDQVHVARSQGVMGPKRAAAAVRSMRYDTALLLTNSFASALAVRMAGVPRRIGYDRDARALLLTHRLEAPRRPDGSWAPIPAVRYYWTLAEHFLFPLSKSGGAALGPLELGMTPDQRQAGEELLRRAGVEPGSNYVVLNPGGNNPAKRWPAERYVRLGTQIARRYGWGVLVNGSPNEAALTAMIVAGIREGTEGSPVGDLAAAGVTLGSLKAVVAGARIMVTNDTGPRHIGAAFGVPLVTLFGPTDHRWTTIPTRAPEAIILADPALPEGESANDHPERCAIERIELERVLEAVERTLV
jgi:heptosyltransferase-2